MFKQLLKSEIQALSTIHFLNCYYKCNCEFIYTHNNVDRDFILLLVIQLAKLAVTIKVLIVCVKENELWEHSYYRSSEEDIIFTTLEQISNEYLSLMILQLIG